ncbi:MAG: S-layer homology domain-containing protein [Tumebacillaceae bacterium]
MLKRHVMIASLAAGLLLGSTPVAPAAFADTTLSVSSAGSGATASGIFTQNNEPVANVPAFLTVADSSGNTYHLDQVSTGKDGNYKFEWTMPKQASSGTYTVTVSIQGDVQKSTFAYTAMSGSSVITPVGLGPYRFTGELNSGRKQAVIYDTATGLLNAGGGGTTTATLDVNKALSTIRSAPSGTTDLTISIPTRDKAAVVSVPGSIIQQVQTSYGNDAHLLVAAEAGTYDLPLKAINSLLLNAVKSATDGMLRFTIQPPTASNANSIDWQLVDLKAQKMVAPVEFKVEAAYGGQSIPIRDYGDAFVSYSIDLTGATLKDDLVPSALFKHPATGNLVPTPSRLYRDSVGHGKLVIMRTGNGTYVPVQAKRTFDDIRFNPRSSQIEALASRYVISGKSATQYDPNGQITRSEFATLMVRALGLSDKQGSSQFLDVPTNEWFTDTVAIGSSLGLISGNTPLQFAPYDPITREQMAALLARSLQYVQPKPYVDTIRILAGASDRDKISSWAREDVALAISTGILSPSYAGNIEPARPATRAESADMLYNLLQFLKMM